MLKLDPYQIEARNFALSREDSAGLFLGCGLGKTAISVRYVEEMIARLESTGVLIIAPRRPALIVWPAELDKWAPWLTYEVLRGPTIQEQLRKKADIYIINYEVLQYYPTNPLSKVLQTLLRYVERHGADVEDINARRPRVESILKQLKLTRRLNELVVALIRTRIRSKKKAYIQKFHAVIDKSRERGLVPELKRIHSKRWPFDQIIWDELTWMKAHDSKRLEAMRGVISRMRKRVGLTGTIITKNYEDLWGQYFCLDGGKRLGDNFHKFKFKHFYLPNPYRKYDWHLKEGAAEEIEKAVADITITMESEDHLDVPPCAIKLVELDLPTKHRAQYDELEKECFLPLEGGDVEAVNKAVLCGKLLQFSTGAVYFEDEKELERLKEKGIVPKKMPKGVLNIHDVKMKAVAKIVRKHVKAGEPILVAYGYKHEAERFKKLFPQAVHLKSGMSATRERELQAKWDAGKVPIILCHPASAGHGLNMQYGGKTALWMTPTYDYDLDHQFNKRIDRRGQEHPTTIYRVVMRDTLDEGVVSCLETKAETRDEFIQVMKKYRQARRKGLL